jgi:acyl dehydratase
VGEATIFVGQKLGPVEKPAITPKQLVQYAGASGDFNPIHYDTEFARAGGFPSVIAHGMLSMAFFGQLLSDAFGPHRVARISARFKAVTHPGDLVTVEGEVVAVEGGQAEVKLTARTKSGITLEGGAKVALET